MKDYDCFLFDWNGTLVDDVDINIGICNTLLSRRGLPLVESRAFYLGNFDFPIKPFYDLLGFDWSKESYEDLAIEYGELYAKRMEKAELFPDVFRVLETLSEKCKTLAIISASMQERLDEQTKRLRVDGFFTDKLGAKDNLGESKVERCKGWIDQRGIDPSRVLFIGDTVHDAETGSSAGCDCVLISRGHNSRGRLLATGCPVFNSFDELMNKL